MNLPDKTLEEAEIERALAEAEKFRAETREAMRPVFVRPGFWAAILPGLAAIATAVYAINSDFFAVEAKRAESDLIRAEAELRNTEAQRTLVEAEKARLDMERLRLEAEVAAQVEAETERLRTEFEQLQAQEQLQLDALRAEVAAERLDLTSEAEALGVARADLDLARAELQAEAADLQEQAEQLELLRGDLSGLEEERDRLLASIADLGQANAVNALDALMASALEDDPFWPGSDVAVAISAQFSPIGGHDPSQVAAQESIIEQRILHLLAAADTQDRNAHKAVFFAAAFRGSGDARLREQFLIAVEPGYREDTHPGLAAWLASDFPALSRQQQSEHCEVLRRMVHNDDAFDHSDYISLTYLNDCLFRQMGGVDDPGPYLDVLEAAMRSATAHVQSTPDAQGHRVMYTAEAIFSLDAEAADLWISGALAEVEFSARWLPHMESFMLAYADTHGQSHPLGYNLDLWREYYDANRDKANVTAVIAQLRGRLQ